MSGEEENVQSIDNEEGGATTFLVRDGNSNQALLASSGSTTLEVIVENVETISVTDEFNCNEKSNEGSNLEPLEDIQFPIQAIVKGIQDANSVEQALHEDCFQPNFHPIPELYHNEINEVCPHDDFFDDCHIPIQAAVKGVQGKTKRKSYDEILGNSKVNKCSRRGGGG